MPASAPGVYRAVGAWYSGRSRGGRGFGVRGGSLLAVSRTGAVAEVSRVVGSVGFHRGYEHPCVPARAGAVCRRTLDPASRRFPTPGRPEGVLDDVSKESLPMISFRGHRGW